MERSSSKSVLHPWNLPDFHSSFAAFLATYPDYSDSISTINSVRRADYPHLEEDHHVCLDYGGIGLFSKANCYSNLQDFALTYASSSLISHALYQNSQDSVEGMMRARIIAHLKLDERHYSVVFAADSFSAIRLLVDSFSFHDSARLLLGYDFKSESIDRVEDLARAAGAKVMRATLSSEIELDRESLRRKLLSGKIRHKSPFKGIFVYPLVSRVTGAKNSPEWIEEARSNNWCVALDISGMESAGSVNLAELSPDFVVGSFYKVFGMDPTGFGCLVIKKTMFQMLKECSGASSGMVKIVKANRNSQVLPRESVYTASQKLTNKNKGHSYYHRRSLSSSFQGLDHIEKLGKIAKMRQDCLLGWLRTSLLGLRHPTPEHRNLVNFHSPEDAGPAISFSLVDDYGDFLDPLLVQRLANRSNISLGTGVIRDHASATGDSSYFCVRKQDPSSSGSETNVQRVICATVGLVTTFGDVFRLWEFVAQFLDSGFCSRELLQYRGLNQQTVFL